MPRIGRRRKVAQNIYVDSGGYEVRIQHQGHPYTERHPLNTPLETLRRALSTLKRTAETERPPVPKNCLDADTPTYLALIETLKSYRQRRAHLKAWSLRIGTVPRLQVTRQDVLAARVAWQQDGLAPKTINHRCATLRHLYRLLDGPGTKTPCDDVKDLHVPKTPIQRVSEELILAVDLELHRRELTSGRPFPAKTRARFRVLVSTGRRPSEIMRAVPSDVNIDRRVWIVRDGKGGFSPGLYLNDDMIAAWKLFIEADAWGYYNVGGFCKTIRNSGWPADVRPYNARHSTWIAASERGADLADIAAGAGHKDLRQTRRAYVPILNSRMQRLGEVLEGRFGGFGLVPESGPARKSKQTKA